MSRTQSMKDRSNIGHFHDNHHYQHHHIVSSSPPQMTPQHIYRQFPTTLTTTTKQHFTKMCTYCKNQGKSEVDYTSHFLREKKDDKNSPYTCPEILKIQCSYCYNHDRYFYGHYKSQCPFKSEAKSEEKQTLHHLSSPAVHLPVPVHVNSRWPTAAPPISADPDSKQILAAAPSKDDSTGTNSSCYSSSGIAHWSTSTPEWRKDRSFSNSYGSYSSFSPRLSTWDIERKEVKEVLGQQRQRESHDQIAAASSITSDAIGAAIDSFPLTLAMAMAMDKQDPHIVSEQEKVRSSYSSSAATIPFTRGRSFFRSEELEERNCQIFITLYTGKEFSLMVELSDRIEKVKQKIQDKEGFFPDQFRLCIGGYELKDGSTLLENHVEKDSRISLFLKLRSGGGEVVSHIVSPARELYFTPFGTAFSNECANLMQNSAPQSPQIQKKRYEKFCLYCKRQGKSEEEYTSHFLRESKDDKNSRYTCPEIVQIQCSSCFNHGRYHIGHYLNQCPHKFEDITVAKPQKADVWTHHEFPKFDSGKIIRQIMNSGKYKYDPSYKYYQMSASQINNIWSTRRAAANKDLGYEENRDFEEIREGDACCSSQLVVDSSSGDCDIDFGDENDDDQATFANVEEKKSGESVTATAAYYTVQNVAAAAHNNNDDCGDDESDDEDEWEKLEIIMRDVLDGNL